jgi:hypothetical protein
MFQQHTFIYTTFHPADRVKASRVIADLAKAHSNRVFTGRHETTDAARLAKALSCSSLTLILESEKTSKSLEVRTDIELSLAKTPPNQILRILLPLANGMPGTCDLSKNLADIGVEMVSCDDAAIADALDRLDLLGRYEPKLRQAAATNLVSSGRCPR